jgi:hypothetical protein
MEAYGQPGHAHTIPTGYRCTGYRRGGLQTGEKRPMLIPDLREDILVVVREFGSRLKKGAGHLHCSTFLVAAGHAYMPMQLVKGLEHLELVVPRHRRLLVED